MRYFVRGKTSQPIGSVYRIDDAMRSVETYRGDGIWTKDLNAGKVLSDIHGFGGSWYDIDEIEFGELETVVNSVDELYKVRKVWAYGEPKRLS